MLVAGRLCGDRSRPLSTHVVKCELRWLAQCSAEILARLVGKPRKYFCEDGYDRIPSRDPGHHRTLCSATGIQLHCGRFGGQFNVQNKLPRIYHSYSEPSCGSPWCAARILFCVAFFCVFSRSPLRKVSPKELLPISPVLLLLNMISSTPPAHASSSSPSSRSSSSYIMHGLRTTKFYIIYNFITTVLPIIIFIVVVIIITTYDVASVEKQTTGVGQKGSRVGKREEQTGSFFWRSYSHSINTHDVQFDSNREGGERHHDLWDAVTEGEERARVSWFLPSSTHHASNLSSISDMKLMWVILKQWLGKIKAIWYGMMISVMLLRIATWIPRVGFKKKNSYFSTTWQGDKPKLSSFSLAWALAQGSYR